MAKFTPIFTPIEEEKKEYEYTGGFAPIEEASVFTPIESKAFTPIYSGGFEPIGEELKKTYEVDVGKYPLIVPQSKSIEFGGEVFVKGMWGEEAKHLEQLPKTQYAPVDVSDVDYSGSFVKSLLFDVLQRGEFVVANVVDRALKGETDYVQAALNGFTGKEKRDFVDISMGLGMEGAEALAVGLVAGVTLDPINYIPFYKMYKGIAKTAGKTKALEIIEKTSLAEFFNKAFTSGEGAPKELHRVVRFLRKEKRWAESNVFEEVEKLSKFMKTTENAELLTKVRALKIPADKLTSKQKGVLKYLDNQLDRLAREGVRLKMLRPEDIKPNYIPGYYDGLTKVAMDIKSGHRGSPFFTKAQNVKNIVDYDNARNTLIEGVQRAIKGKNIDDAKTLVESFPLASGKMLVDDASGYTARQLLMKSKSVPKPTMNLVESYGYRKIAHINELYRQKVINTVLDPNLPYATPIGKMTNKTVRPGNAYFVAKYRLPDINLKEADEVSQALYKRVVKMASSDLIEIEPKMAEELLNSPYMQKIYKGRGMRVFEMPQRIADYMNKTSELFTVGNKQAEQVLKSAAHLQNLWKPLATIARPFWHVRNVTYNQMQLFLSGVSPWDLIPKALKAQAIQRGKKGVFQTDNFGKIKLPFLTRNSKKLGLYGVGFAGGDITTEGLLKSKMGKALRGGKLGLEDIHIKTLVQRPAEFMEDNAHLVAWLDYIQKSKDPDIGTAMIKGAEHAFKYVFDYGDISVFERSYMKLIDPFYTWHRKAVGLYASELLQHPDKFSKLGKAKRTLGKATPETEQEKALKPDWMKETGYIKSPFKSKEGKPLYIDIAMPPDDLQMLFSLKDMYGVLTPYKTIFELIHNITGFPELGTLEEGDTPTPAWMVSLPEKTWKLLKLRPGRQIDYSSGEVSNVLMIPKAYLRAIETALPTMRDIHNMFPQPIKLSLEKATTKTWSQGTGVGIVTENIVGWRNAIYYEINELQKEVTKEAKKYEGIKFKDKEYNYTESEEYLEKVQRIRELSDKLRY